MIIDCIIPCYNEAPRIPTVLSEITKIRGISHIICVDDGSTDGTASAVATQFPGLTILRHEKNFGKTAAVKTGVMHSNADYVLLFDADLEKVHALEIQKGITAVEKNPGIDMIIFKRFDAPLFFRVTRISTLLSGQRLIKRTLLARYLKTPVKGLELEIAMNRFMMQHKRQVYWLLYSGQNNYWKPLKYGFFPGLWREISAWRDILFACSPLELVRQFFFFCRNTIH